MTISKSIRVLGLIPARGGSKGLPRKNILPVGGRPLISWTISAALESKMISELFLSSDDDETIKISRELGCQVPFKRPSDLANDSAGSMEVIFHALEQIPGYDYIVLLQPTSPLRTSKDIDAAFELMLACDAPSCVSVCAVEQSPFLMYRIGEKNMIKTLIPGQEKYSRRQDLPPVFALNGAIYIANIDWLRQARTFLGDGCIAYKMPPERSIDIDSLEDFNKFCALISK